MTDTEEQILKLLEQIVPFQVFDQTCDDRCVEVSPLSALDLRPESMNRFKGQLKLLAELVEKLKRDALEDFE